MTVTSDQHRTPYADPSSGRRRSLGIGTLALEVGGSLPSVELAYETWGTLNAARDNAILVEHALTGDSHVAGPAGPGHPTPGWWDGLIGPGRPLDTDRWFVIASNVLGGCQGTTGPVLTGAGRAAVGQRFPFVTVRDQVAAEAAARGRPRHRLLGLRASAARWAACGRWSGRSPTLSGCAPASSWRAAPTPRPSRSPGASRSCWPSARTRTSTAATTTTGRRARTSGWAWPGGSPT